MNVIIAYLETMFSAYPQTPRILEAKEELRSMMEDAYTTLIAEGRSENEAVGQVIRDFGNLEEVAPVLGIAATIAPPSTASSSDTVSHGYPPVTMDEAQGYADAQYRTRFRVATAVMLFVLSPALLIALPVAADSGLVPITQSAAAFIGLLALFLLVAIGVGVLVAASRVTAPFGRIDERRFSVNPEVARWAETLRAQHERRRNRALQCAIALWILAPMPLIGFGIFFNGSSKQDFWAVIGVVLVLVFVAAGLGILLPRNWANTVAEDLGRGSRSMGDDGDDESGIIGVIASFYWPLLAVVFLAWSFIGNSWGISWIIWPIGSLLFIAIAAGTVAITKYRKAQQ